MDILDKEDCQECFESERLIRQMDDRIDKLKAENEKVRVANNRLLKLINRMKKYFAPTSGEWQFVDAAIDAIEGMEE